MSKPAKHVLAERYHQAQPTKGDITRMRGLHDDWRICVRCVVKLHDTAYANSWDTINYNAWKQVK